MSSVISANKLIRLSRKYEKQFSDNQYDGDMKSKDGYVYSKGSIAILISAPHGVNHIREGKVKYADMYTGAIIKLMHELTGCHAIYKINKHGSDPNYDSYERDDDYKKTIVDIIEKNNIKLFIDLHGCARERCMDLDIGTNFGKSLNGFDDLPEIIKTIFRNNDILNITHNKIFTANSANNISRNAAERTGIASIQLEINRVYRDFNSHFINYQKLIEALYESINFFNLFDRKANSYIFKALRSKSVFPWDKIEFSDKDVEKYGFEENDSFQIQRFEYPNDFYPMITRYKRKKNRKELKEGFAYLTPRIYDQIFIQSKNNQEGIENRASNEKHIVVHMNKSQSLSLGVPKVGIGKIFFGSEISNKINKNGKFQLYNRMGNIEHTIDVIEESEQSKDSQKVFLNYYQRLLLNMDLPIKVISAEYFEKIIEKLQKEIKGESKLSMYHEELFKEAYEIDRGYFKIKKEYIGDYRLKEIFNILELDKLELIELDEFIGEKNKIDFRNLNKNIIDIVLKKIINTKEINLRTVRPHPTDEDSDIVRLMPNTMKILGIRELDKVVVRHKDKTLVLRALEFDSLEILQDSNAMVYDAVDASIVIGIPAKYRNELDILNMSSIVKVSRDMNYLFWENSNNQVLPIIAVIFTIIQTFTQTSYRIVLSLIFIPIAIYLSLSKERSRIDKEKLKR